jgi:surfeit locus 1 family protein
MKPVVTSSKFPERTDTQEVATRPRSLAVRLALTVCAGLVFSVFIALGTWQVKRLFWKLDLIVRVEQRVHAPAVDAPGRDRWPQINVASDEYRHVRVGGTFLYQFTVHVQAVTELGNGFWVLTPLRSADGSVVLINRGFVSAKAIAATHNEVDVASPDTHDQTIVTGLLRMSEPGGAFLRHNDPTTNHWYSRDVQAIAAMRGLNTVAPYFIDADASKEPIAGESESNPAEHPVGGLTVVTFPNNHLVYAITWYALALMVAGAFWWVAREERKLPPSASTKADRLDRESDDAKRNQNSGE